MSEVSEAPARSGRAMTIAGWVLSVLVIAFMIMDFTMKLMTLPIVIETGATLGLNGGAAMARELGIILAICTLLYAVPQTAVLGAVLLTGYLGGSVAIHVRAESPLFSHVLFGVYLGVMAWGGLYLREPRLRALMPLRT